MFLLVSTVEHLKRDKTYYFFRANQQKAGTKIYSLANNSLLCI